MRRASESRILRGRAGGRHALPVRRASGGRAHAHRACGQRKQRRQRLDDVVVRTEQEPRHAVVGLHAPAEEEHDRQPRAARVAEPAADLVARDAGEVDVEDKGSRLLLPYGREPLVRVRRRDDVEPARTRASAMRLRQPSSSSTIKIGALMSPSDYGREPESACLSRAISLRQRPEARAQPPSAARITSRGAEMPVQRSKDSAPWARRTSTPSTTRSQRASRAAATSAVGRPSGS
jgi:hypothetical protein